MVNEFKLSEIFNLDEKNKIEKALYYTKEKYLKKPKKYNLTHFIGTAEELKKFDLDDEVIIAGILHETITEGVAEYDEINNLFGKKIADLVKECNEIHTVVTGNINRVPIEVLNSIVLSISVDIQSLMIRIASILNSLENPDYLEKDEIKKYTKVGKEIYLPLAMKLGMGGIERRLQDSIFKIENIDAYKKVDKLIGKKPEERHTLVEEVKKEILKLVEKKINVQVFGRPKGYKAIFEKMKKIDFKKIYDLYGIRIICNSEKECYETLGIIHSEYQFIPNAFDDYISKPKENGYKSIHTAILRKGDIFEIQIRTWVDHLRIESNLYWEYKSVTKSSEYEKQLSWERQLVEWQRSLGKNIQRRGITKKRIFVFTPKKEVIALNEGATVIDFAYAIHTDLGNKLKKAKVNDLIVPIEHKLKNLDKVEVTVDKKLQVKPSWINYVNSEKAKSKIRSQLGIKTSEKKEQKTKPLSESLMKKIKMADCCHPLPGEDVIGYKTTKRKIIIHKKDCENLKKLNKSRLVEIEFERDKGKTELRITGVDRIGLLGDLLNEIKKSGAIIDSTNFKIKNTGYVEALFVIEIKSINKLENLMEKLARLPSIHSVERL